MKKITKLSQIFLIFIFLTSCKTSIIKDSPAINSEANINENPISEAAATNPISPYGITKLAVEKYSSMYCW